MDYDQLPPFVKDSTVLSTDDKIKLALIDRLPTAMEVDVITTMPEIYELLNAFIGDQSSRNVHLQLKAKEYLQDNQLDMAWKVLLL
ncbi:MAG: hypothetical protein K0R59_4265 [Sphingobacterium sp.]|jgi:hypothetical protein|uniref:hypothetical protein n=1 Tax=unclassified Sphingobacterium TaxID=2609468 RepID=UPI000986DAE2|nr:hypothetical protein [Sphingobacterium sp. CZ-UAM]MDF2518969.1 hypothetical protein [Sphingobacterium sp.]OOG18653.1 hypothetical protein BWD42_01400 [Sphingobacterium sp. CZ-UAM]